VGDDVIMEKKEKANFLEIRKVVNDRVFKISEETGMNQIEEFWLEMHDIGSL
jgi:hypothetical protein